ncbi:growth factor receptor-bound protein 10-like [Cylas formicarius]|uniref:growth factor receptor-bound protein 10-like n=1 Tax=Cylas formicarius TaxID=197179 RepID=UPI0029583BF2|nr:growth factor receptor-bound protein 10-like [Cylas formicarius]XP_060519026.1 growth factor receptor-bound protein 10-like [Cylas formicarius]
MGRNASESGTSYNRLEEDDGAGVETVLNFYRWVVEELHVHNISVGWLDTATDVAKQIAIRQQAGITVYHSISEFWRNIRVERPIEDHELVLKLFVQQQAFRTEVFRFGYQRSEYRYNFLKKSGNFFIRKDQVQCNPRLDEPPKFVQIADPNFLITEDEPLNPEVANPIFASELLYRNKRGSWVPRSCLLRNKKFYMGNNLHLVTKCYYMTDEQFDSEIGQITNKRHRRRSRLKLVGSVDDYLFYTGWHGDTLLSAPEKYVLVLRPEKRPASLKLARESSMPYEPKYFVSRNTNVIYQWFTAMRLAKYGKILKENYETFKRKSKEGNASPERSPEEVSGNRVPMDFSHGGPGRIIQDPQEMEGMDQNRSRRMVYRRDHPSGITIANDGHYTTKLYYHANLGRDEAAHLVTMAGKDGAFLLRNSHSNSNSLVLTYTHRGRAHHHYVKPLEISMQDGQKCVVATLDGMTKFFEVHELIEFYRLNQGTLYSVLRFPIERSRKKRDDKTQSPCSSSAQEESCVSEQQNLDFSAQKAADIAEPLNPNNCPICGVVLGWQVPGKPEKCRICSPHKEPDSNPT